MSEFLVGVDVGTTSAKAAVVGLDGRERAHGRARMPWHTVPTGAEMEPGDLVETALAAAEDALAKVPDGTVVGIGVASMAETGVLTGADGVPVGPAIAWHDARGEEETDALSERLGADTFSATTGLALGPLCTAVKYCWLRAHAGGRRGRRWHNVAEWIVARLGGDLLAELSLASRTGWLDLGTRDWWDEALAACDAPRGLLPQIVPAGTTFGEVRVGPERLRGATLTVAGHDHHSGAVGVGATRDGDVFDSCGTAEAFIAPVRPPVPGEELRSLVAHGVNVGWHTVPGRQAALGAQREGLALQRVLDLLGISPEERLALDRAALEADPEGLRLEDLEGAHATIAGVGWQPSPAKLWRAALDTVAAKSAEILAQVETVAGPTKRLVVSGGWARSEAYRAVKRARLGDFDWPRVTEPGARGAALLAGLAAGRFSALHEFPSPEVESA